jgi:hypothetical protein
VSSSDEKTPIPWRDKMAPAEWYEQLDPGIRFAVRLLHAHGIETQQSCEGGEGHSYDRPSIDMPCSDHSHTGLVALFYLHEYGLRVHDVQMLWRVYKGLPVEHFWRVTFWESCPERADEMPGFIWGYQSTGA